MTPDGPRADEDTALLAAYAAGETRAARLLTERLTPLAYRLALRMLGDRAEAEDVAQEALLRLWRAAPDWDPGRARVSTWIYRVASNLCIDRLRRGRGVGLDEAPEAADPARGAEETLVARDRSDALQHALAQLPDRQCQAVVLRHLEELSNPEIAAIMETSIAAVESLTARGKRELARLLAGQKEDLSHAAA